MGGGPFTRTCDLPEAHIQVEEVSPNVNGAINETAVQPSLASDGDLFRVVDCMYQYNQSIPHLDGAGGYDVQIVIGGQPVDTSASTIQPSEVRFDLE